MYGQRKLMSLRTPVARDSPHSNEVEVEARTSASPLLGETPRPSQCPLSEWIDEWTPSATEGETATDTDVLSETETEYEAHQDHDLPTFKGSKQLIPSPKSFTRPLPSKSTRSRVRRQSSSQHDLLTRYFRKDPIGLYNIDLLRLVVKRPFSSLKITQICTLELVMPNSSCSHSMLLGVLSLPPSFRPAHYPCTLPTLSSGAFFILLAWVFS